jgi:DNA replication and repair protein RecF
VHQNGFLMYLNQLSLLNFKNYPEANLSFLPGVNCFVGNNGAGKTNILDAIHYLCLCKSYFNPIDSQQILHEEAFFLVQGDFNRDEQLEPVYCGLKRNHKKVFKRNNKEYQRLADHIGIYPLVMISPQDQYLISEGSEERRKFLDNAISQTDSVYLDDLIAYHKVIAQRNALLKQFQERNRVDEEMISIYDEQLVHLAAKIYQKRVNFMEEFIPLFNQIYQTISSGAETVTFNYESHLSQTDFALLLKNNLTKDIYTARTNYGIHKDDLQFNLGEFPLKKYGSQGQQKSYVIALKLAHYSFLNTKKGYKPILMLDDIFDKLDEQRIRKLLAMVSEDSFGQLFITDTDQARVAKIFQDLNIDCRIFEVNKGLVAQVNKK